MPILTRFYGITIKMYYLQSEHSPPHIHAIYNEDAAAVDIMTGEVLDGYLPPKIMKLVIKWTEKHRGALSEIWEKQEFKKLPPL